jgi:hypothetical protein
MHVNLKSLKTLQVFPNGCIYFSSSVYLRSFKKYTFLKTPLVHNPSLPNQTSNKPSNFFYFKYRDQIL